MVTTKTKYLTLTDALGFKHDTLIETEGNALKVTHLASNRVAILNAKLLGDDLLILQSLSLPTNKQEKVVLDDIESALKVGFVYGTFNDEMELIVYSLDAYHTQMTEWYDDYLLNLTDYEGDVDGIIPMCYEEFLQEAFCYNNDWTLTTLKELRNELLDVVRFAYLYTAN